MAATAVSNTTSVVFTHSRHRSSRPLSPGKEGHGWLAPSWSAGWSVPTFVDLQKAIVGVSEVLRQKTDGRVDDAPQHEVVDLFATRFRPQMHLQDGAHVSDVVRPIDHDHLSLQQRDVHQLELRIQEGEPVDLRSESGTGNLQDIPWSSRSIAKRKETYESEEGVATCKQNRSRKLYDSILSLHPSSYMYLF